MRTRARKAFTLLELTVAIVVISLLGVEATSTYSYVKHSSQQSVLLEEVRAINHSAVSTAAFAQQPASAPATPTSTYEQQAFTEAGNADLRITTVSPSVYTVQSLSTKQSVCLVDSGVTRVYGKVTQGACPVPNTEPGDE